MSFEFTPMSEKELDAMDIIPDGEYDFEVIKSQRKTSKAGNAMAELQLLVYDKEGHGRPIFDYLVFSTVNMCIRKISHFCKTVGLDDAYQKGSLPEEFVGYSGKCLIGTQEEMPKETGGFYAKKNIVVDYIKKSQTKSAPLPKVDLDNFDDSIIPF